MTDEFMERQKTCTHPEWDSKSSPSVYVPLFLPDPIQTKESSL